MTYFKSIALVAIMTLGFSTAHAGFHIDPSIGYVLSGSSDTTSPGGDVNNDLSGILMGTRVGWGMLGLTFGLEYEFGTLDTESSAGDGDADFTNMGAFVGYELPVLVRAWITYILSAETESQGDSQDGDGFKVGIGYTGFPFISINIEHAIINYDGTINGNDVETDANTTVLSVSLPFTL